MKAQSSISMVLQFKGIARISLNRSKDDLPEEVVEWSMLRNVILSNSIQVREELCLCERYCKSDWLQ